MGAGALREYVDFESPYADPDGYGGVEAGFVYQFRCRAQYTRLRGTETVMAARLSGRQPTIVRVRASRASRDATTDWRIVDRRTGEIFNIRSKIESEDRAWIDFTAESGVAT